ncbi:MAG: 3-oxoacyl-[acyl-carrier-protein] reductase [Chitinophagaceae bacterium]|nr:MAG: 3-oxoacyl-[acyl-carrier-protein] reductase [Chitinophagaceae bacterium]
MLNGKVALITGGTRGIGEGMVEEFMKAGADVAFTYVSSESKATSLEERFSANQNKIKGFKSDASSYSEAETLVNDVINTFGKIDILINNAGITRDNLILRMSENQWDDIMDVNLKSVFNLTKHVARPMMKQRNGSIINISSIVGLSGNAGQSNYAASKSGVIGFSKSIAAELGSRNIRCNVIAPGFIETDMTDALGEDAKKDFLNSIPLKRLGKPSEIGKLAAFLGSDDASYITGQVVSICGGLSR